MKKNVAEALAQRVLDGEVLGIGSGSTVELAVIEIGRRIKDEGIKVYGVPTSHQIAMIASEVGISVLSPLSAVQIDWAFDGADEVDDRHNLIKGRGAAMLNEKIVARISKKLVIIVTEDKLVKSLGEKFPVPVEVIPGSWHFVSKELSALGANKVKLRMASEKYGPIITENGNFVLDAHFANIAEDLERQIKTLTGVVESGLFLNFSPEVLVAGIDRVYSFQKGKIRV